MFCKRPVITNCFGGAAIGLFSAASLLGCSHSPPPACTPAPGTICSIAGTAGTFGLEGDGGPAAQAYLYWPMDVTYGPDDNLYIVDWNNHRIRRVDHATGVIQTVAGIDDLGDGPEGPATQSHFNHPTNVAFDKSGNMVIAAWHNSKIKTVDLHGDLTDTCGTGARAYTGDGGPAKMAAFDLPGAVAFAPDGTLTIMDQANQVVRRVDDNGVVTRLAGTCIVNECMANQEPEPCSNSDKLVCNQADPKNAALCTAPGIGCTRAFAGDGGPATALRMSQPVTQSADPGGRIAYDKDGNLYFADYGNNRVRRIDAKTNIVTTMAGNGKQGYAGDGGPATQAELNTPVDLAFAPDGTLYISDTMNHCIRAVKDGVITTAAGQCGHRGYGGDGGPPSQALLDKPYGVEVAPNGDLYVVDTFNSVVRVVVH